MPPHIYVGTPRELAPILDQHPDRKFRLIEIVEGEDDQASEPSAPALDEKAQSALSLLKSWMAEGKDADEKAKRETDREVEEFKQNMNANRLATGERLVYP